MERFQNLDPRHQPSKLVDVARWAVWDRLRGRRCIRPPGPAAPVVPPDVKRIAELTGPPQATWIGHSSFLLTISGQAVLVDPVFADRVGLWYRRHVRAGLLPDQMPPLDAILITHNHYDHLDLASLRALPPNVPWIVPRGVRSYLQQRCPHASITELGWWQSVAVGPLEITFVPSRHWSARLHMGRNASLWGGYVVRGDEACVYHAGDSAWFDGFGEIATRFPRIDAALVPIGAYEPVWFMQNHHMTPEQAGAAFEAVGARYLVPMHYGTFQMTDEPLMEPLERLQEWWRGRELPRQQLAVPQIGGTIYLADGVG